MKVALRTILDKCDEWQFELDIQIGDTNQIKLVEECLSIPDVTMKLEVQIKNLNQLRWLANQLAHHEKYASDWVDKDTFADREGINERYGFTS